ncbi:MAG: glutamine synthetase, partial [Eubacteriales bacterium]|nr:glutamine synthetase [Eubacteriales bacterium]
DFKYGDALKTADNIMTFKLVIKTIAQRHGLHATFMPKPIYGICGSGMHINQSLFKDGENVFYNEKDSLGLSPIAYSYIGGVLNHVKGMTAITNPLINSYKRLVAGYEAPVYIAWSAKNRSPLIRIPTARGAGTRIELRNPDPSCNPYLAIAVSLAAGLEGIKKGLKAPEAIEKNVYEMCKADRKENGIESLPSNLYDAIQYLKKDELVKQTLGPHITEKYIEAKLIEWEEYSTNVHPWEIEQYLTKF